MKNSIILVTIILMVFVLSGIIQNRTSVADIGPLNNSQSINQTEVPESTSASVTITMRNMPDE